MKRLLPTLLIAIVTAAGTAGARPVGAVRLGLAAPAETATYAAQTPKASDKDAPVEAWLNRDTSVETPAGRAAVLRLQHLVAAQTKAEAVAQASPLPSVSSAPAQPAPSPGVPAPSSSPAPGANLPASQSPGANVPASQSPGANVPASQSPAPIGTAEPSAGSSAPGGAPPNPSLSGNPAEPSPSGSPAVPIPSPTAAGRFHLHRPGTDVDGDILTGSLGSEIFVLKGNVTLHSDPKVDRQIADASESTDPLTVTADEIDVDRGGLSYVAKGHVHFVQGTRSGHADLAMLDELKHTLDLVGNADVLDGERRAAAEKMHYDMLDKGFLGAGDVRIYEPLPTPNPNASGTPAPKRKRRLPI